LNEIVFNTIVVFETSSLLVRFILCIIRIKCREGSGVGAGGESAPQKILIRKKCEQIHKNLGKEASTFICSIDENILWLLSAQVRVYYVTAKTFSFSKLRVLVCES